MATHEEKRKNIEDIISQINDQAIENCSSAILLFAIDNSIVAYNFGDHLTIKGLLTEYLETEMANRVSKEIIKIVNAVTTTKKETE